jgi:rSAM/selenodomain-associated transferase 1
MARNTEYPIFIYYDPPDGAQAVAEWLGDGLLYFPQVGADLGERMFHAFEVVLQKFSRAVLIGSDSPDLPDSLISQAFNVLKTHDAVVGPAADGGYYLIGFSNEGICEAPFGDIQWGTSGVFDVTMAAFRMSRKDVHVLPLWHDIDEYDDLVSFYERQKWQPSGGPATIDFLRNRLGW